MAPELIYPDIVGKHDFQFLRKYTCSTSNEQLQKYSEIPHGATIERSNQAEPIVSGIFKKAQENNGVASPPRKQLIFLARSRLGLCLTNFVISIPTVA